jgi:hypothetical protein
LRSGFLCCGEAVTGLVHGSLDALERDFGVAYDGELAAVEIDLDVGNSADRRNLSVTELTQWPAVHSRYDVLAGDRHGLLFPSSLGRQSDETGYDPNQTRDRVGSFLDLEVGLFAAFSRSADNTMAEMFIEQIESNRLQARSSPTPE